MRLLSAALLVALVAPNVHAAPVARQKKALQKIALQKKARAAAPAATSPAPAAVQAPTSPAAAPRPAPLDDAQRGKVAAELVEQSIAHWVKPGAQVTIRPAIVPFGGDIRNPITGRGPVEVFVFQSVAPQKGFFGRLAAQLNLYAKQKYLVSVDEMGRGQILERLSLAPHARFARFVAEKLPLTSFLDFYKSKRAAEGLWTAVGASGAMAVSPALSGALFTRLAMVFLDGVRSQHDLRKQALDQTVTWAQEAQANRGEWPTLIEAYRAYKGALADQEDGVRPLGLGQFTAALSVRQL